jgi:hypothetical protein
MNRRYAQSAGDDRVVSADGLGISEDMIATPTENAFCHSGKKSAIHHKEESLTRLSSELILLDVTDQFKTGQWLSNQNQPLLWLVKGLR